MNLLAAYKKVLHQGLKQQKLTAPNFWKPDVSGPVLVVPAPSVGSKKGVPGSTPTSFYEFAKSIPHPLQGIFSDVSACL